MSRVELHTVVARMETRVDHSTNVQMCTSFWMDYLSRLVVLYVTNSVCVCGTKCQDPCVPGAWRTSLDQEEWRKAKTKTSFCRTRSFRKFLFFDRRTLSDFFAWLDRCTCGVSLPHHDSQGDLYSRDLR